MTPLDARCLDVDALFSSDSEHWCTPVNVVQLLWRLGVVGLDPCSNSGSVVNARETWTAENGERSLWAPWGGRGLVYCNPPYGDAIPPWTEKCAAEGARGTEIVALLPARTDTRWWHDSVRHADAVLFWRGRLTFLGAASSAPFPSAIAYWGPRVHAFKNVFGPHGHLCPRDAGFA